MIVWVKIEGKFCAPDDEVDEMAAKKEVDREEAARLIAYRDIVETDSIDLVNVKEFSVTPYR